MRSQVIIQKNNHELTLIHDFFKHPSFSNLESCISWQHHKLTMFGKEVAEPRLSQWYGPEYTYSGKSRSAQEMPELLHSLALEITDHCKFKFNSVLANLYRNGQDSMGWHADNETEIDQEIIASYSIGQERVFAIRDSEKKRTNILLPSNSLLLMRNFQADYQHSVPKSKKDLAPRINLTFRRIKRA